MNRLLAFICLIWMAMLLIGHPFLYGWVRGFVWVGLWVGMGCYLGFGGRVQNLCPPYVFWLLIFWAGSLVFSVIYQGTLSDDVLIYHLGGVLMAFVGMVIANDASAKQWLVLAVLVGAGVMSFYGVLQFYHLDPWPADTVYRHIGRVVATFENPNHFGNYVACCLPVGLGLFLSTHARKIFYLSLVFCGLCYTGLLLSGSRGAWVAGLVGGLVVIGGVGIQAWRRERVLLWFRFAIVGLLFLAITFWFANTVVLQTPSGLVGVGERLLSTRNIVAAEAKRDVGVQHRYWIWKITWQMIKSAPVLGQGYGMFEEPFKEARRYLQETGALGAALEDVAYAHNEYLHLWAEGGLVGVICFGGLMIAVVFSGVKKASNDAMIWGGLGLMGTMLTHSLVSYPLHLELNSLLFWLTVGILGDR